MTIQDATVELLRNLVQRPSVTPEDFGCQKLIAERLEKLGFRIEHMPSGDVKNLWARYGTIEPLVVLAGHTDVVPTGDESEWRVPPFSAEIIDNKMYGRGTSDMKGGVAAMITLIGLPLNCQWNSRPRSLSALSSKSCARTGAIY